MNQTEKARLYAEVRALVAENANFLNLKPTAHVDLVNRLLAAGVLIVGNRAVLPCGKDPISYAAEVIRNDPDGGGYLFAEAAPSTPPKPKPKPAAAASDVSSPMKAAKVRAARLAAISAKLTLENGEEA